MNFSNVISEQSHDDKGNIHVFGVIRYIRNSLERVAIFFFLFYPVNFLVHVVICFLPIYISLEQELSGLSL